MCGGFACALGHDPLGPRRDRLRHLLYNAGRLTTYASWAGSRTRWASDMHAQGRRSRSWVAPSTPPSESSRLCGATHDRHGAAEFFGLLQTFTLASGFGSSTLCHIPASSDARGRAAPLPLGCSNGFLAVSPVYAFVPGGEPAGALPGFLTWRRWIGDPPPWLMMAVLARFLRRRGGTWACGWLAAAFCCSALSPSAFGILPIAAHIAHG